MCVRVCVSLYISSREYFNQSKNLSMYVPSKSQAALVVASLQIIIVLNFHCTHFSSCKTIYWNGMKGNIFQKKIQLPLAE